MAVNEPPGELMYMVMSRSGSADSSVRSWAITSLADASSIWTPRKMIRSSNILLYGLDSLIPYEVRSTNDGMMYRLVISRMLAAMLDGRLRSVMVALLSSGYRRPRGPGWPR